MILKIKKLTPSCLSPEKIANLYEKAYGHSSWSKDSLKESLKNLQEYFFAGFIEDELIAMAHFNVIFDESELYNLVVHPDYQKKGYGKQVLEFSIKELCKLNVKRFFLEVRQSNLAGRHLYEKLAFKKIATRKNYYQHPLEDAEIYELEVHEEFEHDRK